MEILFMVFMIVVSIMSLFAVMVVLRDIVKEILAARREKDRENACIIAQAERIIAEAKAKDENATSPAPIEAEPEAVAEEEAPAEEASASACAIEPEVKDEPEAVAVEAAEEADSEGMITFSMGQQQTLEEKYLALPAEKRGWYDEIIKYASVVEGSKRFKNVRYEEYKVGKNRIVRMLIKRGIIHCEFILHNSDFKNYINENKISVRQSATTMLVENAATVDAVKNSIDIVVAAINEEKEYKKKLARERRRARGAAEAAANNAEAKTETTVG